MIGLACFVLAVLACVYRKLNPNVLMMKSAQDGVRIYGAGSLNRKRDRRILLQRPMRSNAVVIGRIVFQNPAQMFLAQDNDVIQTLAPERSDQQAKPFCQGEAGAIGLSRMPMACNRRVTTVP
jgi:hypothetical protein